MSEKNRNRDRYSLGILIILRAEDGKKRVHNIPLEFERSKFYNRNEEVRKEA